MQLIVFWRRIIFSIYIIKEFFDTFKSEDLT